MTNNLSTIRDEVAALSDQELILEVVKAIGWEVSDGGHYATKRDGRRFMLSDPKTFGRCMLTSALDFTSENIQWARLHEVVSAAWEIYYTVEGFELEYIVRFVTGNDDPQGRVMCDALMLKPRQLCECIVMAQRMSG